MKLLRLNSIPAPLLELEAYQIGEVLPGPTLIEWGEGELPPIFISVLLHGNEISGFTILKNLWRKLLTGELKSQHPLIFFIANVEAASVGLRHLPSQLDFNRVWSGGDAPEALVAQEVLDIARKRQVGWAIDIHNNTGKNPLYSCINKLEPEFWDLAHFFAPHIVYFTEPHEVLSMAFSQFCPSVTIEAGTPGQKEMIEILTDKLETLLTTGAPALSKLKARPPVFHTIGRIKVASSAQIDFNFNPRPEGDLSMRSDLVECNFQQLEPGFVLGYAKKGHLWVEGNFEQDFTNDFLEISSGEICVKKSFVPAMFTQNIPIIKSDCMGYVMESI